MARPTSAFVFSLFGGTLTLIVALLTINTWFAMYSNSGTNFNFSQWYFFGSTNYSAVQAMVLFIIGAAGGVSIVVGSLMQRSGGKTRVKRGSYVVLIGTILGGPGTFFGMIFGGLLSIVGSALGLAWNPSAEVPPAVQT